MPLVAQSQSKADSTGSTNGNAASSATAQLPSAPEPTKDTAMPPSLPPVHYEGPLAPAGKSLNSVGISPSIAFIQFWLANPSVGEVTGQEQGMSLIAYGVDLDMKKLSSIPGATIHFQELNVPLVHNTGTWGMDAADVYVGQPGPYIPDEDHLTRFTWEQHLDKDRFVFEFGKSNAGDYFAIPVCNTNYGCQSLMTQYDGGMGEDPTPYANFLGRIAYNINRKATLNIAEYRSTAQFPWTDGWEWHKTTIHGVRSDSNVYLADFIYNSPQAKYPKSYEAIYFHNTAMQAAEFSSGSGYANTGADVHHGTNGMFASTRQTLYRFDDGRPGPPRALTAFAQLNESFDSKNVSGLQTDFKTGAFVQGLLKSRPMDSYGFNVWWAGLTNNEQNFLKTENLAAGGSGYNIGKNEIAIGPDANIIFKNVIVSPFALRTFNANSMMNPLFAGKIQNGWGVGATVVVLIDKVFGLGPAMF
jgi:porin